MYTLLQVNTPIYSWIHVWALVMPFKTIGLLLVLLLTKVFFRYIWMHWVIVMLTQLTSSFLKFNYYSQLYMTPFTLIKATVPFEENQL